MTPNEYAAARCSIGTQELVARLLEVHVTTLSRRENGALPITREAALALLALRQKDRTKRGLVA